jgi:hypothetical protein
MNNTSKLAINRSQSPHHMSMHVMPTLATKTINDPRQLAVIKETGLSNTKSKSSKFVFK